MVHDFSLELATFVENTEVREQTAALAAESASNAATVTSQEITDLPVAEHTDLTASLPIVPGVIRTQDGVLNMKGESENQGMLLVDSAETVDPVTGSFSIPFPVDAVQSLSVMKTAYNAEYGGFSGGLTDIQTKPPSGDRWQYAIQDVFPGMRAKNGHLRGISEDNGRFYASGPLIKGKLNLSQAVVYTFRRPPVRGLPWPFNEIRTQGVNSLTSLQAVLSPRHVLTASLNEFDRRQQFANITSMVPQSASSDDYVRGYSAGVTDSYQFGSGMLIGTVLRYTQFNSSARGQGPLDMLVTPDGWGGNFFNSWARSSRQVQFLPTLRLPVMVWHGKHELKAGFAFTHRVYDGSTLSHPVQLFRQNGTLAEQIDFLGDGLSHGTDTEFSEFVQDHWTMNDHVAVDIGARLVSQSGGRSIAFAPRFGISFSPGKSGKTVVHAGTGLFYDRVPLLTTSFAENLTRMVSTFKSSGQLTGPPVTFSNIYLQQGPAGFVQASEQPDLVPRNWTWNVEVDRELWRNAALRLSFLNSETSDVPVVIPLPAVPGVGAAMGLASTGFSRYYEVEATWHYQLSERREITISYVHSRGRGDLNTISNIFVPFEQPIIRPSASGVLPSDVPNRVVAWGTFAFPFRLTVSPVVDAHTGLPYSVVDTFQNYVGPPNTSRFPTFFSLDLQVYREFDLGKLPLSKGRMKGKTFRFGIFSLDVTNHQNPLDVFNSNASPNFGTFSSFQRRTSGFVFEVH